MTKILVLISTYNGESHLQQQLDSIFNQVSPNINVAVQVRDDGSRDGTLKILEANKQQFTYRAEQNIGVAKSFLCLLNESNPSDYDYFVFADQDDVWKPDKLKQAVSALESIKGPALYISNTTVCDFELENQKDTDICFQKQSIYSALVENVGIGMTMVMNRELLELLQKSSPEYIFMHDWWVYIVASAFGTVVFDKQSYVLYRQHDSNVIGYSSSMWNRYRKRIATVLKATDPVHPIVRQTQSFLDCYGDLIDKEVYANLSDWISCQHSFFCRLKSLPKLRMFRQRKSDQLFFILMFVAGFYSGKKPDKQSSYTEKVTK